MGRLQFYEFGALLCAQPTSGEPQGPYVARSFFSSSFGFTARTGSSTKMSEQKRAKREFCSNTHSERSVEYEYRAWPVGKYTCHTPTRAALSILVRSCRTTPCFEA